MTCKVFFTF